MFVVESEALKGLPPGESRQYVAQWEPGVTWRAWSSRVSASRRNKAARIGGAILAMGWGEEEGERRGCREQHRSSCGNSDSSLHHLDMDRKARKRRGDDQQRVRSNEALHTTVSRDELLEYMASNACCATWAGGAWTARRIQA